MTKVTRPVRRETGYSYRGRPIMLLLEEGGKLIRLREKGRRRWFTISIETVFWLAVRTVPSDRVDVLSVSFSQRDHPNPVRVVSSSPSPRTRPSAATRRCARTCSRADPQARSRRRSVTPPRR